MKKPRTSIKHLLIDSALYSTAMVVTRGLRFLILPLLTAYFTASQFGVYDLGMFYLSVMVIINRMGMDAGLNFYFSSAKTDEDQNSVVITAGSIIFCTSCFLLILSSIFGDLGARIFLQSPNNSDLIFVITLAIICTVSNEFSRRLFKWQFRRFIYMCSSVATAVLFLTFLLLFIFGFRLGVKGIFLSIFFSNGIVAIFNIFMNKHYLQGIFSSNLARRMFVFGYPQMVTSLGAICLTYLSRPLLAVYYDLETAGVYALAVRLAGVVQLAYIGFTIAWSPFAYFQYENADAPYKFARITTLLLFLLVFSSMLVSLFSNEIVMMMGGHADYRGAGKFLSVLSFSPVLTGLAWIVPLGFNISKKTYHNIWIYFLVVIINIFLSIILIPKYGCWGAITATLFSQLCYLLIAGYVAGLYYPIPYKWNHIWVIITSGTVFALVGYFLRLFHEPVSLVLRLLLAVVFLIIIISTKVVTTDNIYSVVNMINSKFVSKST